MPMGRRLAAIMAADMAGYSRLMERDEDGVVSRQKIHRRELIDPEIANAEGRIVKTTGDGMLVEFASVHDAVRCAIKIQTAMASREAEIPFDGRILYRIGINLCDVIEDEGDVFGDGVNVASRLEGMAEPGGVCISDVVHHLIGDRIGEPFRGLGQPAGEKYLSAHPRLAVDARRTAPDRATGGSRAATAGAVCHGA
jgi:class 3 adenylate cyclase